MKNMLKKAVSILLVAVIVFGAAPLAGFVGLELPDFGSLFAPEAEAATEYESGYYTYEVDENGEATITDVDTSISGDVIIPSTLGGYPVTSIGYRAFYDCDSLISISIPNSVTNIGNGAFSYCGNLTSIIISDSVIIIGNSAFENCFNLTSVTIGNSVTRIDNYAFDGCSSLTSIMIPDSVTSIGNAVFKYCKKLKNIIIPDSVTHIGKEVFYECESLSNVEIGNGLSSMGDGVFKYCPSLTNINVSENNIAYSSDEYGVLFDKNMTILMQYPVNNTRTNYIIPDSVITICENAFYDCTSITNITIGKGITKIENNAFMKCSNIKNVYYSGDILGWCNIYFNNSSSTPMCYADNLYIGGNLLSGEVTLSDRISNIGNYTFYNCTKLSSIIIPNNVTHIGNYAFYNCTGLEHLTIPNSVIRIGYYAFYNCQSLENFTLPNNLTQIENYTFYNCANLTEIIIPDKVISIDSHAFCGCTNLETVSIPDSVTSIGDWAFNGCVKLSGILIPNSVTKIDSYAFRDCSSLVSVDLPDSMTSISGAVFYDCINLANISIPNSVTTIGSNVFYGCKSLTNVMLPNNLLSIGSGAFYGCDRIVNLKIPDCVTSIGENAFMRCSGITSMEIPNNTKVIDDWTFNYCNNLSTIIIPGSITVIDNGAFSNCTALTDVYYLSSEQDWNSIEIGSNNDCLTNATIHYNSSGDIYSGTCGDNVTWSIDNAGILTISGTGEMDNLLLASNYPWDSYASSVTSVVIEDGVTSIGDSAFSNCRNITSVTIGKGLTSINELAFGYCSKLTNITIPDNITNICDFAFYCCGSLISVEIGSGVKVIEDSAFLDCTVADIYYNGTEEDWNNITIEDFNDCLSDATFHFNSNDEGLYTITYIVEGGTYIVDTYRERDQIRLPDAPAKNGFCFVGWVDENGDIALIPSNMPATNLTFVAVWEIISYTIIFDANGGYFYSEDEKEPIVADVVYGESIRDIMPPDPVRESYIFLGYTDRNGNIVSVPETMPAEDLILTALWEPINQGKYTIYYYDGSKLYDSHSYAEGENIEYPPCPEMAGYTFSGWSTYVTTMPAADISVYALWTVNVYSVNFDANGGQWSDGSTTKSDEIGYGSPIVAPDEDPMREGFIFCGWADKYGNSEIISDFGNMEFGAEYEAVWLQDLGFCSVQDVRRLTDNVFSEAHALYEIRVMYRPEKIEFLNSADTSVVVLNRNEPFVKNDLKTSGVVLIRSYDIAGNEISSSSPDIEYEIWNVVVSLTEGEYKVRTNYKNDNVSWESIGSAYRFCMQYDFPPVSEDSSYKIEKYRMDTSGEYSLISSETVKTNASHVSVTPELIDGFTVTSDSVLSAAVESDGSTTLKVYYSRNIYSVKFYDGENLLSNSNYYYDSIIAEPVPPVKQGYKLAGWSKDGKTVLSDLGNVPASDIVFYAVFEEAKFNVTFDANGGDGVPEDLINQNEGTLTLPSAKPSKPGSVFVGWSTDPMSSKPEYQAGDKVELTEDIKFYAVYTEVTEFNGNHYAVFDLNMTWDEAKTYCESLGGHLMTITTQSEQDFAETLISERKMNCYWLGGYEEPEGNWKWVTGETFSYMNWGSGEPNNEGNGEECIEIYAKHDTDNASGHWNDLAKEGGNGFYKLSSTGFICEWDLEKTTFNGHEYSVIDKSMTWLEAKAYCESLGGHLVTITSEEENDFVFGIINESFVGDCWFGATDEKVEGVWEWVTGEKFEYTNWYSGQPDNDFNGTEDYLASYYGSAWNDIRNDDLRAEKWFVCEWNSENSNKEYIAQWIVDGRMIQVLSVPEGTAITSPEAPVKEGYEFLGWTPEVPETMLAQHMTFVAVWQKSVVSPPEGDDETRRIAIFSTERSLSVQVGKNMRLAFGILENGVLDGKWKNMAIVVSDTSVISLSDYGKTEYGYDISVTGLKPGKTNITITETATGISTTVGITVCEKYINTLSYQMSDMPSFYPEVGPEKDILTNIYDVNGMYVNNFTYTKSGDTYIVEFDVYNSKGHTGSVDVYDKNGCWIRSESIEKMSVISSLWETGEQFYYLITDAFTGKLLTYEQASFAKHTPISIEVPEGGYFTVSNNFSQSPGTFFYNFSEILFDAMMDWFEAVAEVVVGDIEIDAGEFGDILIDSIVENPQIRDLWIEIFKTSLQSELEEFGKKVLSGSVDEAFSVLTTDVENILYTSLNIDWKHLFKTATGIGEEAFEKFSGPAGVCLSVCFEISKQVNKLEQAKDIATSVDETYATVYTVVEEGYINQNGVIVNTNGNVTNGAMLQVFKISDDEAAGKIINRHNPLETHQLYNICFVKNDELVQPSGKVTVHILLPIGISKETCKIYRQENNGEWTELDARVEGKYIIFETDHFSLYTIVGNKTNASIISMPQKTSYFKNDLLDVKGLSLKVGDEVVSDGFYCAPAVLSECGVQKIVVKYGCTSAEFFVDVKEKATMVVRTPSTTTVNYGDSIVLHADLSETLPSGWKVEWTASNGNFSYTVSDDSATCTITPNKSGSTTFTATVYDSQGNAVSKDEQSMTSKAGFFDKIIAFFKKLFGLTKVIPQALKYIY